jgi:hypothetical protein
LHVGIDQRQRLAYVCAPPFLDIVRDFSAASSCAVTREKLCRKIGHRSQGLVRSLRRPLGGELRAAVCAKSRLSECAVERDAVITGQDRLVRPGDTAWSADL